MSKSGSKYLLVILPILAALFYLGCLPWAELRASDEAVFATIAREMCANHDFLHPTLHGEPLRIFPLYSMFVALLLACRLPLVVAVRLPSVLSVFGMAAGAFCISRRHKDLSSGILAAVIVLTSFGAMRIGIVGQAEVLHGALLSGAWFSWHTLGPVKRRWRAAWGVSLGLMSLDFLAVGLRGVLLFYLPFLVTTMPPRARRLLRMKEHLRWGVCYMVALYIWVSLLSPQPLLGWFSQLGPLSFSAEPEGFFHHLVSFPFRCFRDLLPWGFFLWVPFCLALRPLEPRGSICGFLRAATLCLFVSFWLIPGYSPLMMMAALPIMAVMMSFTLPIVMHRCEREWRVVTRIGAASGCLCLLYNAIGWLCVASGRTVFPEVMDSPLLRCGAILAIVVSLALMVFVWHFGHRPDGVGLAWISVGLRFFWVCAVMVTGYLTVGDRRWTGEQFIGMRSDRFTGATPQKGELKTAGLPIPSGEKIYLFSTGTAFPAQMLYTGHLVQRVRKGEELPAYYDGATAYLAAESQPVFPGWTWEKLVGPVDFNQRTIMAPALLVPAWGNFWWGGAERIYSRKQFPEEEISAHAAKYFESRFMNLYLGTYKAPEASAHSAETDAPAK